MRSGWAMTTIHTLLCPLIITAIMTVFLCCGHCSQQPTDSPYKSFTFSTPVYKGLDTLLSLPSINKHQLRHRHPSRLTNHNIGSFVSPSLFSSTFSVTSAPALLAQLSRKSNNDNQDPRRPRILKNALKLTHSLQQNINSKNLDNKTDNNNYNNNYNNNNNSMGNKTTNNGKFFDDDPRTDPNNDLLVRKVRPQQQISVATVTRQNQLPQTAGCPPLNDSFLLTNDSEVCRTCLCDEDIIASSLTSTRLTTASSQDQTDRKNINENPSDVLSRAIISTTNNNIASNNESLTEENDYQLSRSPARCMWVPCINVTFGRNESFSNNEDAFRVGKCLIAVACVLAFLSIFGFFLSVHRFCERRGHFQLASSDEDLY